MDITGETVIKALWKEKTFIVTSASVSGGSKVTVTNESGSTASIRVVAAAYDAQGRFVLSAPGDKKINSGESISVTVPYDAEGKVKTIKVFVLNPDTMAPLTEAWTKNVAS